MRARLFLPFMAAVVTVIVGGCGKPIEPAPYRGGNVPAAPTNTAPAKPTTPTAAPATATEPKADNGASLQGYAHALTEAPKTAAKAIDLSQLTAAVKQFEVMEGRLPKSLDELVTMKYFPMLPPAPRGSKINYNAATGDVTIVPVAP